MTGILLYIRSKQISRGLSGLGFYSVLFLAVIIFLVYASFKAYQKGPDAYYLVGLLVLVCSGIQFYRKDKAFVYQHIESHRTEVYLEYVVLTLPFAISSILTKHWFCFPVLLAVLYFVPFLKSSPVQRTYFKNLSAVIPASNFEWLSGFRKSFFYLLPVYLFAIAFSWFRILPLFVLVFITIIIVSFYDECEPLQILSEGSPTANNFLSAKLFRHSLYLVALYAPVVIINTIFNPGYWVASLLFVPVQVSLLCFAICLKYSNYRPAHSLPENNVILSIVSIGAFIPYLLPVPLIMVLRYYGKAQKNLEQYLYD